MARFDTIDRQLLSELQEDGRVSFSELGRRVGLSAPAVAERVRRLEEQGVILGYTARVDAGQLGYPLRAFVRVSPGGSVDLVQLAEKREQVVALHHITGAECFIAEVVADSMGTLKDTIEEMLAYGSTITNVVLETVIDHRPLVPTEAASS